MSAEDVRQVVNVEQLGVVMIELSPRMARDWTRHGMLFLEPSPPLEEAPGVMQLCIAQFDAWNRCVHIDLGNQLDWTVLGTGWTSVYYNCILLSRMMKINANFIVNQ